MSSTTHASVAPATKRAERRAGQGRRFDDHAANILKSHVTQLDVHRRSVMLFYLLFGLLAGFFLGIAGAKGVFAKPALVEHSQGDTRYTQTLRSPDAPVLLPSSQVQHTGTQGIRYAAIIQATAVDAYATAADRTVTGTPSLVSVFSSREVVMVLLGLIFAVTVALTATFLRYLSRAYAPHRRVRIDWASVRNSRGRARDSEL